MKLCYNIISFKGIGYKIQFFEFYKRDNALKNADGITIYYFMKICKIPVQIKRELYFIT